MKLKTLLNKLTELKTTIVKNQNVYTVTLFDNEMVFKDNNGEVRDCRLKTARGSQIHTSLYGALDRLTLHSKSMKMFKNYIFIVHKWHNYILFIYRRSIVAYEFTINDLQVDIKEWMDKVTSGICPIEVFYDWLLLNNTYFQNLVDELSETKK